MILNISQERFIEDNFDFIEKIGRGGFGEVFKVVKKESEEVFAIKEVRKD